MAKSPQDEIVPCLFCDLSLVFPNGEAEYLGHLFLVHRLVIADVQDIKYLAEYLKYWKVLFDAHNIAMFCTTMLLNQKPDGTPSQDEKYYLLSDVVKEDREIRQQLHTKYLATILERHQFEKNDENFEKGCLYCRDVIKPTRAAFLEHLYLKHFLQLGKSENLVFIDELIDVVDQKMKDLICLYCEKVFKDRMTLKEHMRKKGHKRINPENKFYDKFFLVNYYKDRDKPKPELKSHPTTPKSRRAPPPRVRQDSSRVFQTDNDDSDWSEWEAADNQPIKCLFCDSNASKIDELKTHMTTQHSFNFDEITKNLNFYKRVKLVNYIRHQILQSKCVNCGVKFSESELLAHMTENGHFLVSNERHYNQPEFFFPTIDDDPFLCFIEDSEEDRDDSAIVICEDTTVTLNEEAENFVKENLLKDKL